MAVAWRWSASRTAISPKEGPAHNRSSNMIFKATPKTPLSINYCSQGGSRQAGRQVYGIDINIQEVREREVATEEDAGDKGEKDSITFFWLQYAATPSNWFRQYRSFSVSQCSCFWSPAVLKPPGVNSKVIPTATGHIHTWGLLGGWWIIEKIYQQACTTCKLPLAPQHSSKFEFLCQDRDWVPTCCNIHRFLKNACS